jgi:hypothetical protein
MFDLEGYDCKIYSLANALKKDVENFLHDQLQYDVWTNDTDQKAKFREFLVWYGKQKRQSSDGTYWTGIVENQIIEDAKNISKYSPELPFIAIVPDIRYSFYEKDEDEWVQNNSNWTGKLVHVRRFGLESISLMGNEYPPLNADEAENDPKIEAKADYKFKWETVGEFPTSFYSSEHYTLVNPLFNNLLEDIKKI